LVWDWSRELIKVFQLSQTEFLQALNSWKKPPNSLLPERMPRRDKDLHNGANANQGITVDADIL